MLNQAREFHETVGLTGLVLTKLDGTARGGAVVSVVDALRLPVKFIGERALLPLVLPIPGFWARHLPLPVEFKGEPPSPFPFNLMRGFRARVHALRLPVDVIGGSLPSFLLLFWVMVRVNKVHLPVDFTGECLLPSSGSSKGSGVWGKGA